MHYLYLTINLINKKKYIGQRLLPDGIDPKNDNYLGSGNLLLKAIKKHGIENFKKIVLSKHETQSEVDKAEIELIKQHHATERERFYNIDSGGQYNRSEDHAKLKSKSMREFARTRKGFDNRIKGINNARIKQGENPLPYTNYPEYIKYYTNQNTTIEITLKEIINDWHETDTYKQLKKRKRKLAAQALWNDKHAIKRRNKTHKQTWDNRRQRGDVWTNDNKLAFAIGKCKQYNAYYQLYLLKTINVPFEAIGATNLVRQLKYPYDNEQTQWNRIDRLVKLIKTQTGITIDKYRLFDLIEQTTKERSPTIICSSL